MIRKPNCDQYNFGDLSELSDWALLWAKCCDQQGDHIGSSEWTALAHSLIAARERSRVILIARDAPPWLPQPLPMPDGVEAT